MRRSALPLKRSAGFSPRPLVSFGLALPTGCASRAEYLDLRLDPEADSASVKVVATGDHDPADLVGLCAQLSDALPVGVTVTVAAGLDGTESSLQEAVTSCDWEVEVLGVSPAEMARRLEHLLVADVVTVARERKGRTVTDDIRPNLRSLAVSPHPVRVVDGLGEVVALTATLSTRPRGVRPSELCGALGGDVTLVGASRTCQWIESEDLTVREEPLSPAGLVASGRPVGAEAPGG